MSTRRGRQNVLMTKALLMRCDLAKSSWPVTAWGQTKAKMPVYSRSTLTTKLGRLAVVSSQVANTLRVGKT